VSADITVDRCWLEKPRAWVRSYPCKNDLELKQVLRFWMRRCVVEGTWASNQTGVGFVLAAMHGPDGDGQTVQDVTLTDLLVRNMSSFLTVTAHGTDNIPPELTTRRVSIRNVLGANINGMEPFDPANGNKIMLLAGLTDTEIDQVTLIAPPGRLTRAIALSGTPAVRSTIRRAILTSEGSGIVGDGVAPGAGAVAAFLPEPGAVSDSAFIGLDRNPDMAVTLIPGNDYPATIADVGFADPTIVDRMDSASDDDLIRSFTLRADSPQRGRGFDAPRLTAALDGVATGEQGYPIDSALPDAMPVPSVPSAPPSMTIAERLSAAVDKILGVNSTHLAERDAAVTERDVARTAADTAIKERDAAVAHANDVQTTLDTVAAHAAELQAQIDALTAIIARLETGTGS
jgi:hypothetical protein